MSDGRLSGRVAVVTGAGSGIGRAIAVRLAAEGARVIAAGQRAAPLAETVALIAAAGGRGRAVGCDVADAGQVAQLMQTARDAHGRLDILVNNAARNRPDQPVAERVAELADDWWAATLAVNLTGAFLCCKHALPAMLAAGGGSIVNIASTSGIAGNTNQGAYVSSKHGLIGLTRSLALDYAAHGVRANAICPGFIETERSLAFSTHNRGPDWLARQRAEIPLGRLGKAEEVAALAAFLASDESAFITGAVIPIDGGKAARRG
ncbi:MAG: SDR family NAD(P)-dependent oxidoreductase [Candidatus Binatia bacterium]